MSCSCSIPDPGDINKPRKGRLAIRFVARKPEHFRTLDPLELLAWPELDDATPDEFSRVIVALGRGRLAPATCAAIRIRRRNKEEREARILGHIRRVEADIASGVADEPPEDPWVFLGSPA